MHRWTKRKTIPTSTLKTDTKLLAINIQYQLIQNSLDWISDFRMTSLTCTCASYAFLVNLNISDPKLSGRDFAPLSLYNLSGNKYIEIAFYVSVKFCTLWVQRERVGGGRAVSSDILEGRGLLTNRIESFLITTIELNSKFQTPNSFKASFEESKDVLELNWYQF